MRKAKTVVLEAGTVVDQQPGGFDLGGHFCEGKLNRLKFPDGFAELLTFEGVACSMGPGALGQTKHLGSDANATLVQRFDRDLVALARLAQHVRRGHLAVFEDDLAGGGSADA